MRHLLLLRHAKSSWATPGLADIDRPLNARGRHDAPLMAERLRAAPIQPDRILCSTAQRTRATAAAMLAALDLPAHAVIYSTELYSATVNAARRMIMATPSDCRTLLVIGHNPTWTDLANLHGDRVIDNVPTCGCVTLQLDIADWSQLQNARGRTVGFDYPKRAAD